VGFSAQYLASPMGIGYQREGRSMGVVRYAPFISMSTVCFVVDTLQVGGTISLAVAQKTGARTRYEKRNALAQRATLSVTWVLLRPHIGRHVFAPRLLLRRGILCVVLTNTSSLPAHDLQLFSLFFNIKHKEPKHHLQTQQCVT